MKQRIEYLLISQMGRKILIGSKIVRTCEEQKKQQDRDNLIFSHPSKPRFKPSYKRPINIHLKSTTCSVWAVNPNKPVIIALTIIHCHVYGALIFRLIHPISEWCTLIAVFMIINSSYNIKRGLRHSGIFQTGHMSTLSSTNRRDYRG